jgi:3-oxoacyl-[acyl-carrier-protein] synthase-3
MHVPSTVITNDAFVKMGLDTNEEWITSRTGIEQRRLVGRDEPTSELAVKAARQALLVADLHASDIDLIIVATCTPDQVMPSTASIVQDKLGAKHAGAFDLNAACAGFAYALSTGAAQIESRRAKRVMVIGADELSIYLDWRDRGTCILFGDGAGAVLLEAGDTPGILASTVGSDGSGASLLNIRGGGSRYRINGNGAGPHNGSAKNVLPPGDHYLRMNGPQIFRWATQMMTDAAEQVMRESGLKPDRIDLFIPHQANMRIIEATARKLGLPADKVFSNVSSYGNTSAASIPIALCEAIETGRIDVGDNIVLTSFGAGLTWSALALHWTHEIPSRGKSPWTPFRQQLDSRVAAVQSALKRQERRVRTTIEERLGREP